MLPATNMCLSCFKLCVRQGWDSKLTLTGCLLGTHSCHHAPGSSPIAHTQTLVLPVAQIYSGSVPLFPKSLQILSQHTDSPK